MPTVTKVTEVPATVQTPVVSEVKVTGSRDDAVAATEIGDSSNARSARAPNVIVCVAFATVKLRSTSGAAL